MRAGRYPLVLANILATPLKLLAPLLSRRARAGGQLVLAGILERQADELSDAYAPWLDLEVADERRRLDPDDRRAVRAGPRGMISRMSLATRCTACGTVFRVVQDQLKVSEGWVRCGRCDEVFNALEGLFDLERDARPRTGRRRRATPVGASGAARDSPARGHRVTAGAGGSLQTRRRRDDEDDGADVEPRRAAADPIDAHLFGPRRRAESAPKPAGQVAARDRVDFADARFDSDLFDENAAVDRRTRRCMLPSTDAGAAAAREHGRGRSSCATPSAQARWRSPADARWRSALRRRSRSSCSRCRSRITAATSLAAHWPGAARAARRLVRRRRLHASRRRAASTTCSSRAPRLTPRRRAATPSASPVTLRNRGALPLAMPSIDLTLTDGQGQLIARRALSPRDFRRAPPCIAAGRRARRCSCTLMPARPRVTATPSRSSIPEPCAARPRLTWRLHVRPRSAVRSPSTPSPPSRAASRSRSCPSSCTS